MKYETKDSGKKAQYPSGMQRDTAEGKLRYDLIPVPMLKRLAGLYARGAEKYGDRNWERANSQEELDHMKAALMRHLYQWAEGEVDEDHAIAVVWNMFAYEMTKEKIDG